MICRSTSRASTAAAHKKSTAARMYSLLVGVLASAPARIYVLAPSAARDAACLRDERSVGAWAVLLPPRHLLLVRNHHDPVGVCFRHHRYRAVTIAAFDDLHLPSYGRNHAQLASCRFDALQVFQRRFLQLELAVALENGALLGLGLLDAVAVLDGAEVLQQIHHYQQKENGEGDAE